eukprot:2224356-Amphidinium_carterae.1
MLVTPPFILIGGDRTDCSAVCRGSSCSLPSEQELLPASPNYLCDLSQVCYAKMVLIVLVHTNLKDPV